MRHIIIDKPMVEYVYDSLSGAGLRMSLPVGYKRGNRKFLPARWELRSRNNNWDPHAVLMTEEYLRDEEG